MEFSCGAASVSNDMFTIKERYLGRTKNLKAKAVGVFGEKRHCVEYMFFCIFLREQNDTFLDFLLTIATPLTL